VRPLCAAGDGQALGQAVEECLGLGVDPMEVLAYQQELDLTLADQKAFDGLEYPLAPLVRIQGLPGRLLHRIPRGEPQRLSRDAHRTWPGERVRPTLGAEGPQGVRHST
jgi:hypothetical protein